MPIETYAEGLAAVHRAGLARAAGAGARGARVLGLFTGGTLAHEARLVLEPLLGSIAADDGGHAGNVHRIVDLGADELTQSRPHPMIDAALRSDPAFAASDAELMDDALDGADARLDGVRPSRIPTDRAIAMTAKGEEFTLFANVFPKTPSGKVELKSTYLQNKYGAPLADYRPVESRYPLALISPASDKRITATFGGCRDSAATPPLEMHPDDAKARGLSDGDRVKVWNDLGEVHLTLEVTEEVPPGVVCSLKGAWMRTSDNGQTVSALAPSHHADISEGACYNDARVEVARR